MPPVVASRPTLRSHPPTSARSAHKDRGFRGRVAQPATPPRVCSLLLRLPASRRLSPLCAAPAR
eukprot:3408034-Rhodomonas_salina.2